MRMVSNLSGTFAVRDLSTHEALQRLWHDMLMLPMPARMGRTREFGNDYCAWWVRKKPVVLLSS
ncbi:hypothetical protein [Sphingobium sp. CCH11-B1]|jgi:hypothetical protein|uniref:hypothetical protein n=1 Tax=Sphingobium sp. CCH11-B1 TaxID=1768781 RepID=UPI000829A75B|nr:hypothetical protein [Sphingobium sp. CCH11-B1]